MKNAPALLELLGKLQTRGFRLTFARKGILEILTKSTSPLSAKEIHDELINRQVAADKVTVYREIEFLVKEALLVRVQFADRNKRYELASDDHHHHLICENCEAVEDIELSEDFEQEAAQIAKKKQFQVLRHSLEFFGLCKACA